MASHISNARRKWEKGQPLAAADFCEIFISTLDRMQQLLTILNGQAQGQLSAP
jgi:hypothetical protein